MRPLFLAFLRSQCRTCDRAGAGGGADRVRTGGSRLRRRSLAAAIRRRRGLWRARSSPPTSATTRLSVLDPRDPGPARSAAGRLQSRWSSKGRTTCRSIRRGGSSWSTSASRSPVRAAGPHGVHGLGDQPGYVVKLDVATGRGVGRGSGWTPTPGTTSCRPTGKTLFVTHYDEIRWRQAAGRREPGVDRRRADGGDQEAAPLCPAAHGVRLSSDGSTLYATCGPDEIAVVDVKDRGLAGPAVQDARAEAAAPPASAVPTPSRWRPDGTVWVSSLGPNSGSVGRGSVDVFDPELEGGRLRSGAARSAAGAPRVRRVPGASGEGYQVLIPEQVGPGDAVQIYSAGGRGEAPQRSGFPVSGADPVPERPHVAGRARRSPGAARSAKAITAARAASCGWIWRARRCWARCPIGVFPDGLALVPSPSQPTDVFSSEQDARLLRARRRMRDRRVWGPVRSRPRSWASGCSPTPASRPAAATATAAPPATRSAPGGPLVVPGPLRLRLQPGRLGRPAELVGWLLRQAARRGQRLRQRVHGRPHASAGGRRGAAAGRLPAGRERATAAPAAPLTIVRAVTPLDGMVGDPAAAPACTRAAVSAATGRPATGPAGWTRPSRWCRKIPSRCSGSRPDTPWSRRSGTAGSSTSAGSCRFTPWRP